MWAVAPSTWGCRGSEGRQTSHMSPSTLETSKEIWPLQVSGAHKSYPPPKLENWVPNTIYSRELHTSFPYVPQLIDLGSWIIEVDHVHCLHPLNKCLDTTFVPNKTVLLTNSRGSLLGALYLKTRDGCHKVVLFYLQQGNEAGFLPKALPPWRKA